MKKRFLSLVLVVVLVLGSSVMSLAAQYDIKHITDEANYTFNELRKSPSILKAVAKEKDKFTIEVDGNLYVISDVDKKLNDGAEDLGEAIEGLQPYTPPTEELTVVEVSAINKTVKLNVTALEPAEGAKAKVVIFKLNDKGEKAATAFETVAAAEIKENVVTVDLSAKTVGDADYAFVVTVGENEAEVTETLEFKAVEKLVVDIKAATTAQLVGLLGNETYFTGFNVANVDAYKTNVTNKAANLNTVADVQELVIDAVAANSEFDAFVAELTDDEVTSAYAKYLVLKGQFSHALDANMDKYMATTGPIFSTDLNTLQVGMTTFTAMSDAIDVINLGEVVDGLAVENAKPSVLNEYKSALQALVLANDEVESTNTKAEWIVAIDAELKAIADARTAADTKIVEAETAMAAYEAAIDREINDTDTDYAAVVEAIEALDDADLAKDTLGTNTTALGTKVTALEAATEELTIIGDAIAALAAFEDAFGEGFAEADAYKAITPTILVDITADPVVYAESKTSTDLKTALATLNAQTAEWVTYNAVIATEDAAEMRSLLFEFEDTNYTDLTSAQKLEFAGRFIEKLAALDDAPANFTAIDTLLGTEVSEYIELISGVNSADNISGMITALTAVSEEYGGLGAQAKADIAEAVLAGAPYATIAAIVAAMGL